MKKEFYSLEEMKPYYNAETNTYEFMVNGEMLDVTFNFDLNVDADIVAYNIFAYNIYVKNIYAWNITAYDIVAHDIVAQNIQANNIRANNILYHAVCFAYNTFACKSIIRTRTNSKHFCLDNEIVYER